VGSRVALDAVPKSKIRASHSYIDIVWVLRQEIHAEFDSRNRLESNNV